jgi:hypothetical protein
MSAIFYSKVTGVVLGVAVLAGLIGLGMGGTFSLNAPLDLGLHAVAAIAAIYVGFTAHREQAVAYAKLAGLAFSGLAIFGMYQGHPYGNITAHLIIGLWGLWAGFGASDPVHARR